MIRRLPLLRTQRTIAGELLRLDRTLDQACVMIDQAHRFAQAAIAEDQSEAPPAPPIACKAGCAWCCQSRVIVTEAEAIRIGAYLRAHLDAAELNAVRARVAAADDATHGQSSDERFEARVPCPLLHEQMCIVHEVRPLACVGYNSADASVCERASREGNPRDVIPAYMPQVEAAGAIQMGLIQGMRDQALRASALELNAAVRIALERDGVADRWLAGRHPFAPAVVEDATRNLDQLLARVIGN